MNIFAKYLVKSMLERKARCFLLLFALTLSTGLFIGSMGAVDIGLSSFVKPQLEQFENKDLSISPTHNDPVFSIDRLQQKGITDIIAELRISGVVDTKQKEAVNVIARDYTYNTDIKLLKGSHKELTDDSCIISNRISKLKDWNKGDSISVIVSGKTLKLKIVGVAKNEGIFYLDDKKSFQILIPHSYLAKQLQMDEQYNFVSANKAKKTIQHSIREFNSANTDFRAEELFNEEAVNDQLSQMTIVFYCMLTVVMVMSAMIIYSSFKLIVTERLPIIGTFLSQGATKRTIKRILYLESIGYGVIGGILGCLLGTAILYIINYFISPMKEYGLVDFPDLQIVYFIAGLIFSLILAFVSSYLPIRKMNTLEVKDVILQNVHVAHEEGWKKTIVGFIFVLISITGLFLTNSALISSILFFMAITGVLLFYPKVVDIVSLIIFRRVKLRSGAISLVFNNLRTSKVLRGNITLMGISMIAILLINSIGSSLVSIVSEAYENMHFDLYVATSSDGITNNADEIVAELRKNPNIKADTINREYFMYATYREDKTLLVTAVEPESYLKRDKYLDWENGIGQKLRNIKPNQVIITDSYAKQLQLKKGDKLKLTMSGQEMTYAIIGTINGKLYQGGTMIFMDIKGLPPHYAEIGSAQLFVETTAKPSLVKKQLKDTLQNYQIQITTHAEMRKQNLEGNQQMVNLLGSFSYMAACIAAVGVFNNISIGFIQRKKELALLTSLGMGRRQRANLLILESILTILWSIIITVPTSYLLAKLLKKALEAVMPLDIMISLKTVPVMTAITLLIVLIATIPALRRNRKLSVIEELKYE